MKLLTNITPRADGTVVVEDGKTVYTFVADETGVDLVCDVEGDDLIARLLSTDNFQPADEADFDRADELLRALGAKSAPRVSVADLDPDAGFVDDEPDDDPVDMGAEPVEANTPPAEEPATPATANRRKRRAG